MNILVTGGAGFIGSHLVEHHLGKGDKVHAVDNLTTGTKKNVAPFLGNSNFHFDAVDILPWPDLEKAVAWSDRIYHMAAVVGIFKVLREPIRVMATNIRGCERLLRVVVTSTWSPQVVIASSSEVYGHSVATRLAEDDDLVIRSAAQMRWNYAISKLADEAFGLSYARRYGLPITVVRLFNTIGPRQTGRYGMVVPRFVSRAVQGGPLAVYGDGAQTRSFCDVRDVVVALDLLAGNPRCAGEIINVGNDKEITIAALAETVIKRSGSNSTIKFVSYEDAYGEEYEDIPHRRPSLKKLRSLIAFTPKWTLDATLDDLIETERKSPGQNREAWQQTRTLS